MPGAAQLVPRREPLRLGYACAWWHPRLQTWSYTASRLRNALDEQADVVDIEAQRSLAGKAALRGLYAARRDVPWQYSALERALLDRAVRRGVLRTRPEAVLGIGEVDTPTGSATFLYQDCNAAAVGAWERETGVRSGNLLPCSDSMRDRRAAQELERARSATGVFTMGRWFADFLVGSGVDPCRVSVARAGMNSPPSAYRDLDRPVDGRLLFVGADFRRKGGDQVVEGVRRLRAGGDRPLHLTVVGPDVWPLSGAIPAFVDFRGRLSPSEISALYADHDLFVMPSRFEAFGVVFVEALVAGLPCIARRAFAMPEIVEDGVTGSLLDSDDPDDLAQAVDGVLRDEEALARVAVRRELLIDRYNWRSIASGMVDRIDEVLGR